MLSRGIVGLPLWDYGQKNPLDLEYAKVDPDFYRRELDTKLEKFRHYLLALEMQQEAHYQSESNRSWSKLDLFALGNFRSFLASNRFWAIHTKNHDVDITEFENELTRAWSVREACGAIDFAFRMNADAVTLHPGVYNLNSGRFWPKTEDALTITNQRRVIFTKSLTELIDHFVQQAVRLEAQINRYQERMGWVVAELRGLLHWLGENFSDEKVRYQCLADIFHLIEKHQVPIAIVRFCKNPDKGLHLALENVEPPNFLACTPKQMASWHHRMTEIFLEAADRHRLPAALHNRYRPMIVLDPNHMLNAKVILTQPSNRGISHIFEDYEDLFLPFVNLPCDMPAGTNGKAVEPLLNRFVRENDRHILYAHLAGSAKMDNYMTTHDPIPSFRTKMFMQTDAGGSPTLKFATGAFDPEKELNLEEVVQVVGLDKTWVLEVFDCPDELLMSSWIHTDEYLTYLAAEYRRNHEKVRLALLVHQNAAAHASPSPEENAKNVWGAGRVLKELEDARFYIRPHRKARELWKAGYDEAAFYVHDPAWAKGESASPVDIFATVKDATGKIWIRGLDQGGRTV